MWSPCSAPSWDYSSMGYCYFLIVLILTNPTDISSFYCFFLLLLLLPPPTATSSSCWYFLILLLLPLPTVTSYSYCYFLLLLIFLPPTTTSSFYCYFFLLLLFPPPTAKVRWSIGNLEGWQMDLSSIFFFAVDTTKRSSILVLPSKQRIHKGSPPHYAPFWSPLQPLSQHWPRGAQKDEEATQCWTSWPDLNKGRVNQPATLLRAYRHLML